MSRAARAAAHFAARRIAPRLLGRFALLRFLPSGLVVMLLAEAALLALRELRARPELRQTLWRSLCAGMPHRRPAR